METNAQLDHLHIAPRKVRIVANLLKGMDNVGKEFSCPAKKSEPKEKRSPRTKSLGPEKPDLIINGWGASPPPPEIMETTGWAGEVSKRCA